MRLAWFVFLNLCSRASNMTRHSSCTSCCCHASLLSHPKLVVRSVVPMAGLEEVCKRRNNFCSWKGMLLAASCSEPSNSHLYRAFLNSGVI
uniref:Putative secreted protein n=1 Tax=Ixodes ricinus TaxID=34613 RepID=A0A6B0U769_IXORI